MREMKQRKRLNCNKVVKFLKKFYFVDNVESDELQVIIKNSATGEILRGDSAPKPDEVDEWLATNPGYELISRDIASDSEDDADEAVDTVQDEQKEDEFAG